MLTRFRESLTLLLLLVLPFHALMVTFGTKLILGPFKDTPLLLSAWKELVLLLLLIVITTEILLQIQKKKVMRSVFTLDRIDLLIIIFFVVAVCISFLQNVPLKQFIYGFKYDVWPLVLFFMARRVAWSNAFKQSLLLYMPILGVVVAIIGSIFMLMPAVILEWLGYSEAHSLYMAHKPVAGFQQIGGSGLRRLQSVLSGPNQAGIWLLIPLGALWARLVVVLPNTLTIAHIKLWLLNNKKNVFFSVIIATAIIASFSRSAWLAMLGIFLIGILSFSALKYKKAIVSTLLTCATLLIIVLGVLFPNVIVRSLSTNGHLKKPIEAVQTMVTNPLGLGLGSAGPASNHLSDSCVIVEDANITWAEPYPELCVFLGETQLQPKDYTCNCPHITENWFLQIGVELGFLGGILYMVLLYSVLQKLYKKDTLLASTALLSLVGICIAGLFLHSFEDSAIAYTIWLICAVVLTKESNT